MGSTRFWLVASLWFVCAGTAHAQSISDVTGKLPVPQADRPLTMTEGTLRVDASFSLARACVEFVDPTTMMTTSSCATGTFLSAGAGYSFIDDFELGATVLPLQLTDEFDYGDPSLYARYRLLGGGFEAAVEVTGTLSTNDLYDFALRPGIPLRLHIAPGALRFDTGAYLPITFGDSTNLGLEVPLALTINIGPSFFFGPRSGIHFLDLDAPGDTLTVPLGLWAGYTLPASGVSAPLADIWVAFDMPLFLTPGLDDVLSVDVYALTVGLNVYIGGS